MLYRIIAIFASSAIAVAGCTTSASSSETSSDKTHTGASVVTEQLAPSTTEDATPLPTSGSATSDLESTESIEVQLPVGDAETLELGDAAPVVTNDGVLAAAVIIVGNGDLEAAIAEGLISEAEADAALLALDTGTLDQYAGG